MACSADRRGVRSARLVRFSLSSNLGGPFVNDQLAQLPLNGSDYCGMAILNRMIAGSKGATGDIDRFSRETGGSGGMLTPIPVGKRHGRLWSFRL